MYGYIISSFVYFYLYANLKYYIQNHFIHTEKHNQSQTLHTEDSREEVTLA